MCTGGDERVDGEALDIGQRVSLVMVAPFADRAAGRLQPRARLAEPPALFRHERRLHPRLGPPEDADVPGSCSFVNVRRRRHDPPLLGRRDGQTADPGEDPRGAPDLMPLEHLRPHPGGRAADQGPEAELFLAEPSGLILAR